MKEIRKKPQGNKKNQIQPSNIAPERDANKPLDKGSHYNDRKHPQGGCGC